jgi:hypothetical protein
MRTLSSMGRRLVFSLFPMLEQRPALHEGHGFDLQTAEYICEGGSRTISISRIVLGFWRSEGFGKDILAPRWPRASGRTTRGARPGAGAASARSGSHPRRRPRWSRWMARGFLGDGSLSLFWRILLLGPGCPRVARLRTRNTGRTERPAGPREAMSDALRRTADGGKRGSEVVDPRKPLDDPTELGRHLLRGERGRGQHLDGPRRVVAAAVRVAALIPILTERGPAPRHLASRSSSLIASANTPASASCRASAAWASRIAFAAISRSPRSPARPRMTEASLRPAALRSAVMWSSSAWQSNVVVIVDVP